MRDREWSDTKANSSPHFLCQFGHPLEGACARLPRLIGPNARSRRCTSVMCNQIVRDLCNATRPIGRSKVACVTLIAASIVVRVAGRQGKDGDADIEFTPR